MAATRVQVDARQVERKAHAAQQSMQRRTQRLEKAQAAAVQAQHAARDSERQINQHKAQHQQQHGRATLQQVCCILALYAGCGLPQSFQCSHYLSCFGPMSCMHDQELHCLPGQIMQRTKGRMQVQPLAGCISHNSVILLCTAALQLSIIPVKR